MIKLRRDARLALAGACSGLFSVSVFLLGARVLSYYDYLSSREAGHYGVEDLWWVPLVVWHVVLSIAACLLIHRYLGPGRVSTFLRWQAIGIVSLAGWGLTVFTAISLNCMAQGNTSPIEHAIFMFKFAPVAQFVAAVFAANVLYGSAIQASVAESLNEESRQPT